MHTIDDYVQAFALLKRGSGGKYAERPVTLYKAPHKPLLLLAVLDLVAEGALPQNLIELGPDLEERFDAYWSLVMTPADQTSIAMPFFHLSSEGFWHLLPRSGQKHWAALQRYTPSSAQLKKALLGAKLDRKLYALIGNPGTREILRRTLVEAHFGPVVHEALFRQGGHGPVAPSMDPEALAPPGPAPLALSAEEHPDLLRRLSLAFHQFEGGIVKFGTRVSRWLRQEEADIGVPSTNLDDAFDLQAKVVLKEVARRLLPNLEDPGSTVARHTWRDSTYVGTESGRVLTWQGWRTRLDQVPSPYFTLYLDRVDNGLPVEERVRLFGTAFAEAIAGYETFIVMFVTRLPLERQSEIEQPGFIARELPRRLHACVVADLATFLSMPALTWSQQGVALLELQRRLLDEPEPVPIVKQQEVLDAAPEPVSVTSTVQVEEEVQTEDSGPALDDYLVWASREVANQPAAPVTEPWPETDEHLPAPGDAPIAELIDRWIRRYLPDRERTLIENRYPIYESVSTVAESPPLYEAPAGWQDQLQDNALRVLREQREDVAAIFELFDQLLAESDGVLTAGVMPKLLAEENVQAGDLHPQGFLAFLADLNDGWTYDDASTAILALAGEPPETPQQPPAVPAPEQGADDSADKPEAPVTAAPPVRETSPQLELFRHWMARLLTRREREIVARRYGLFGKPEEPAALARRYDEPEEKLRKAERSALRALQDHRHDLAPIFVIIEEALDEHDGVFHAPLLLELPEFAPARQIGLLPAGFLSLLAELRGDWRFYEVNGGTLLVFREHDAALSGDTLSQDEAGNAAEVAAVAAEEESDDELLFVVDQPAIREPTPAYLEDDEGQQPEAAAPTPLSIDFVSSLDAALENVRRWNRDLETDLGKEQWGRRTVTYFVYDPQTKTFAPSKFCAYTALDSPAEPLSVASYGRIDYSDRIFDGQRARQHLVDHLPMELVTPDPDSMLTRNFEQWAAAHQDSINVHPDGPQFLLPVEAIEVAAAGSATELPINPPEPKTTAEPGRVEAREEPALAPSARRRKVRETGPLWVTPAAPTAELDLNRHSPLYPIEMDLRERLQRVDFVGELAVERSQFEQWSQLVQKEAIRAGSVRPKLVPPALFVTLMVLTARYSEEEARKFWQPYARMVWGQDEASQVLQGKCRAYFRRAIDYLSQTYGLVFPQRSSGDLVRPVYRHAIIPAYLERDFVEWLKSRWKDVLEVPPDHLVAHLQQEHSLRYLPPTLNRFISEPDTAVAAADLIRDMAFAASLYAEGQSLDFIAQLLADNPIERSLWEEFVAGLAAQEEKERRRPQTRLEWVWSLETAEIMLRLRNAILYTTSTPDLAVWVEAGTRRHDLARADLYSRLDPWKLEQETWLVDELLFASDGPLAGKVVLLGDDDSILWEQDIPPLPRGPVQFFRLTQQRAYALPVDNNSLQPGDYVLACEKAITLNGIEAAAALSEESLTLPYHLKHRFSLAGIYQVSLPLTVKHERQTILEVATSGTGLAADPPSIRGHAPIPGLSPRVPPAFADRDIWLLLPGASNRLLDRTTLWLRSQRGTFQRHLLRELDVEVDDAGTFWVPLRSLLDEAGGFYSLELRQGLRALLPAPLELVHVPGLECVPPPLVPAGKRAYTPVTPPSARIRGIQLEQIGNLAQVEAAPGEDDWLVTTWHQLQSDCRLLLRVNEQSIPLAWPVKRFFAWTEPEADDGVFTPEELEEVTLQASGSPDVVAYFFLSIPDGEGRLRVDLSARGQFSAPIRAHNLHDMILHHPGPRTQVDISVFSDTWPLFIVRRPVADPGTGGSDDRPGSSNHPQITTVGIPGAPPVAVNAEEARAALTNLLTDMGSSEPTAKELWLLASEPIEALSAFDPQRLQEAWEPLDRLLLVHDAESWEERYGLLPYWAVTGRPLHFTLNRGTTVVYPEAALQRGQRGIGYANLGFVHGVTRVYVAWRPSDTEEALVNVRFGMPPRTRTDSYLDVDELDLEAVFQCKVCGRFLSYRQWRRHTHADQKFPDTVDLLNTLDNDPVLVRIAPASLETRLQFQRDPSDVVDSAMVPSGLRSRQGHGARRGPPPNPTTAAGYRVACSAWLERYWEMPGACSHIPHLFAHPRWQAAAQRLEDYLDSDSVTAPPPFIAMSRLLSACRPRDGHSVYGLDRNVLLLALLARHAGHDPVGAVSLRRRIRIDENLLGQLLYDADIYIPELLEWALTWSELFFVHSLT